MLQQLGPQYCSLLSPLFIHPSLASEELGKTTTEHFGASSRHRMVLQLVDEQR